LFGVEKGERKLIVHADNARPHIAKATKAFCDNNFLRIVPHPHPHPPYSLDLAPSDFSSFLPGHLKTRVQGQQFGSADELLLGVRKILDEISVDTLEAVSREWIDRLDRCIAALQQMESAWNEVNNDLLSHSCQRSHPEMLILSWHTRY
jgi:hypothetical protein